MTTNGTLATLVSFAGTNGANPQAGLTLGNDGNFYGTTYSGGNSNQGTIFQVTTNGTLTTLFSFAGTNGANPGGLTLGTDGNLYGTTSAGGIGGRGTVFQVTTNGTLTSLVSFTGGKGRNPEAGLTLGTDGSFYGTTSGGGNSDQGAIFQITANNTFVPLASFMGVNGANPQAGLTLGNDGNLYGTTYGGGNSNQGTIFQVTTGGTLTTLVCFAGTNGANPQASLMLANDGNFYGTTYGGGSSNKGTIFQVTTSGALTTLVSFAGTNGANPEASLTLGNDGNFYGTTYSGGSSSQGTIFRVTTNGALNTLLSFASFPVANGANPEAGLMLGNDGNFYGTTYGGGSGSQGTIFKVTTNGVLTTVTNFTGGNGANPKAALALGNDGNFYGTTYGGGSSGVGVVFELGFPPSITAQPTSIVVTNGGSASFNVAVSGTPLYYQWFTSSGRTATAVPGMAGVQLVAAIITDGGAGYSSVPQVQFVGFGAPSTSGTAVVSNGMVTSIIITSLGIYFLPPTIQIASPSPTINQALPNQTNATLTLSAVTSADATNYFVLVTNYDGSATSAMVGLAVFLPPQGFMGFSPDGQQLDLQLTGTPNYPYTLQTTTNLTPPINWQPVVTILADTNGNWTFTVTNMTDVPARFYRAVGQ